MNPPVTPTKAGNDINSIVKTLSGKWNLQITLRDSLWSPSKNTSKSTESQIYSAVQYLYWRKGKTEGALAHAIAQFEDLARKSWVPKPRAEPDLLPRSDRLNTHHHPFLKTLGSSDEQTEHLQGILLGVLKTVVDRVKVGDTYPIPEERPHNCELPGRLASELQQTKQLAGPKPPAPLVKYETSPQLPRPRIPHISEFFKPIPRNGLSNPSPNKAENPSSDEFQEEDSLFQGLVMPDAPSILPNRTSSSGGHYKTLPQESKAAGSPNKPKSTFRKPEPVPWNRKRPHTETSFPSVEDKVARGKRRSSGYSRTRSANEIGLNNTVEAKHVPNNDYPLHGPSRQTKHPEEAGLARSFSDASSASLWSSTTVPSTGGNTPNTSFHTDFMSTSSEVGMENDKTTITLSKSGDILPAGLNKPQRSTSEPPSSGITNTGISGEDCGTERHLQRPRVSPEPVRGAYTLIKGLKIEDYLERYLFQDSPFGKHFKPVQSLLLICPSDVPAGRRPYCSLSAALRSHTCCESLQTSTCRVS